MTAPFGEWFSPREIGQSKPVRIYADVPRARVRQIMTDLLVAGWTAAWIWAAVKLYELVSKLAVPGEKLASGGDSLSGGLSDAGGKVDNVPGVGGALATPLKKAADAARSIADAGRQQQEIVHELSWVLVVVLLLVPMALVVLVWLPLRVRWMRRAATAAGLRDRIAGRDLLALRALMNQPLRRLVKLDPDVSAKWRAGDATIVNQLAALELRTIGLRAVTGGGSERA